MTDVKQPQDHKSKTPAQVEADGDATVTLQWRDLTLELPASIDDWSLETLDAYEHDLGLDFLRSLLGARQWAKVAELKPKKRDVDDLAKVIQEKVGYGQGE